MSSSTIGQKEERKRSLPLSFLVKSNVARAAGATILGATMLASVVVAGAMVGLAISFRNLPDVRLLRTYAPTETSYIYDVKGKLLSSLHGEAHRRLVRLNQVSPDLKRAVLAIEDSHFYHHYGINPTSIGRALLVNFKSGGVEEGASTLTMQLVKNIFLSHERTYSRKLAEAVLAIRVEQIFSKDRILEMYLNNIYWGHNNYGAQTAAESYFNKPASQLTLAESAMMAGLIQAPEVYSPLRNYKAAKERQALVLARMRDLGWITAEQEKAALNQKLAIGKRTAWQGSKLPFVTDAVIQELNRRFGPETVLKGGMRVQTTIDYDMQKKAEATVQRAYRTLRGRGLAAKNLQIALVAVDPRTHFVKALVGGVDYSKSQLNRAIQSRRQPGSAFKPFIYYTAFASGRYTPDSVVNDAPISIRDGSIFYRPKNYGGKYSGSMSLRTALTQSTNIPAVILGQRVGVDKVVEVCRRLGFKSPLLAVPSLPLGSVDVTPLEMAGAYATFASNGWHSDPTVIVRVTDSQGNVMLDNTPKPKLVLDPWATASLTSVLQGVIASGTARSAAIGRPAAGKTGTTDSERNVWFVGYVPQLSTAVWIGDDTNRTLGKGITGGHYAAPIWRDFMIQALKNEPVLYFPSAAKFPRPSSK
ncbi:MAG: penicillin-binding protein 1A [Hydrococcus sp. C42_A2020_068]|uniref:transglycosylase domain-containing protein n=1 Tax=Pleurocapsa sp. PCC 7327 TaxID=118163 RepID=UPI00029FC6AF|nr:penicillin-binding protein 1A [Pleurocapsa sp. PCC 7327]AFY78337.1 penicillin-binding protein, 1A family [Pleurocapsa sp. PCC 7327]MBF2022211.1 penicillin-binding protein 1A [Hydrococcus sp. C42_A2020_068]